MLIENHLIVLDVGKTNCKLSVLDAQGALLGQLKTQIEVKSADLYPQLDVQSTWDWLLGALSDLPVERVTKICVAAHGASAALIDPELSETGLVLPIMDYEWDGLGEFDDVYDAIRPNFSESYSPKLPVGLNLGRQLHWQEQTHSSQFHRAKYILPLAQYWSWRLSGVMANEVSSLGSHTDLWNPVAKTWSLLAKSQKWSDKFAPILPAWWCLGPLRSEIIEQSGISPNCQVLTGVHDSNAGLSRFWGATELNSPTIISTGTWTIALQPDGDLNHLQPELDMLVNVDITGNPVACARFMGGREYQQICQLAGGSVDEEPKINQVQALLAEEIFAIGNFSDGSGPIGQIKAKLIGEKKYGSSLAALSAALMIDLQLDLLDAQADVIIEGSFANNTVLCDLVASLRPQQNVMKLEQADGVTQGCFVIANWPDTPEFSSKQVTCQTVPFDHLQVYRKRWRQLNSINTGKINA